MNTFRTLATLTLITTTLAACGEDDRSIGAPTSDPSGPRPPPSSSSTPNGAPPTTCTGVWDCTVSCNGDDRCQDFCWSAASDTVFADFGSAIACLDAFQCSDQACADANCREQLRACFEPSASPPPSSSRTLSCADWFDCTNPCGQNDDGCFQRCTDRLTVRGEGELRALSDCVAAHRCEDSACLEARCRPQLDACFDGA